MEDLPYPRNPSDIARILQTIDKRLLQCSERFIEQQVKKPIESMLAKKEKFGSDRSQADWLNIYSIYCANQQLSEACNKLWATVELSNATSKYVWKKSYTPIGEKFSNAFCLGTLIPTLYYAEISSIVSILSLFGCVPVMINRNSYYLLRTEGGWTIVSRSDYVKNVLGLNARSWHDRILATYNGLVARGIRLPEVPMRKVSVLKNLRNQMHYQILGDLRMWRMFKSMRSYQKHLPIAIGVVRMVIDNLSRIKCVTTGCEKRFENLIKNLSKVKWLDAKAHRVIL